MVHWKRGQATKMVENSSQPLFPQRTPLQQTQPFGYVAYVTIPQRHCTQLRSKHGCFIHPPRHSLSIWVNGSLHPSTHLSTHPSIHHPPSQPAIDSPIHLPIYSLIYQSIHPSTHPFIPSIPPASHPFIYPSIDSSSFLSHSY